MKKVLLLALNARWTHSNPALYYLRNEILKYNHDVEILQLNINNDFNEILFEIFIRKPDVLAISVYIWNSNYVKKLIGEIKKILPNLILILGGPEVGYNHNYWLKNYPVIDAIVIGYGENAFGKLAKNDFEIEEKIVVLPPKQFDKIDFPYKKEDFDYLKNRYVYYETSRGCTFRCAYCLSSREEDRLQFRSLDKIYDELEYICSFNPKIIKFVDRTFNAKKEHSQAIWKYLIKKNYNTKFHFEIHPALLNESDFSIFSRVKKGYFQFEIGIQTLNKLTLQAINRNDNWDKIKENIARLTKMNNIYIHLDLIVGLPNETLESFKAGFEKVYALKPDMLQIGFLKVLPGTDILLKKEKYGLKYLDFAPYTVISTKTMDFLTINRLHRFEDIFNRVYNSKYFNTLLTNLENYFSSSFKMFWHLSKIFKNYENLSVNRIFRTLYNFISQEVKEQFLIDCIRYDWAIYIKTHYYPEYMNNEKLKRAKKVGYEFLWKQNNIDKKELKKAVFFVADTVDFRQKYQNNRVITVFLNSINKKINLPVEV